jgi:hypothetical protein
MRDTLPYYTNSRLDYGVVDVDLVGVQDFALVVQGHALGVGFAGGATRIIESVLVEGAILEITN